LIISLSTISINTQIRLEEEFLEQEFGNEYLVYTKKVRRWL
jgi:protein-S-isoprenylcysteine O-methyltransferase Ste14